MNTIQDLFQQAQLAEAAYANFFSDTGLLLTNSNDVKAALISKGMSDTQATAFAARYQVISLLNQRYRSRFLFDELR